MCSCGQTGIVYLKEIQVDSGPTPSAGKKAALDRRTPPTTELPLVIPAKAGIQRRSSLQLTAEGAVLEGGEQGVEFGQCGAVAGFEGFDGGDAAGEVLLQF